MYPIMQEVMNLILDKSSPKYEEHMSYIDIFNEQYSSALNFYNEYLKNNKQKSQSSSSASQEKQKYIKILVQKANVCFLTDKFFEFEETIYETMMYQKKSEFYLRLGNVYL